MLRTRHHLTRSAALAGLLLATAGAASATAAGPTLSLHRGTLTYTADPAAAVADEISFEAAFIGGDPVLDLHHNLPVTIAANATSSCDPEGAVIRCATYAITAVAADGGPGDDRIAIDPDYSAGPLLPLHARGGDGADELSGGSGRDLLDGGPGDDLLIGDRHADTLRGGDGADRLDGGTDDDLVQGGAGADRLDGGADDDLVEGGAGDDTLTGDPGSDRLDGGDGRDVADYGARAEALAIVLSPADERSDGGPLDDADGDGPLLARDALVAIEEAVGGGGDDQLMGSFVPVTLRGGPGDDLLHGAGLADTLFGDAGADTLVGAGADDALSGGDGDDLLRAEDALAEAAVDCGAGLDRLVHDAGDATTGCETLELFGPAGPTAPDDAPDPGPGAGPDPAADAPPRATPAPRLAVAVDARFARTRGGTQVTRLRLRDVPAGTRLVLSCRMPAGSGGSGACPARPTIRRWPRGARRADLLRTLRGRRLPAGATIELRLTKPGTTGLVRRFTIRRTAAPSRTTLCLPAGSNRARRC